MKKGLLFFLPLFALFGQEEMERLAVKTGFFLGGGGGYHSVKLEQKISATEFSSIFLNSNLQALGESGGGANPFEKSQSTLAPQVQAGYLFHFDKSSWIFGLSAEYAYLNLTFTQNNVDSFPSASYLVVSGNDQWAGHLTISSVQTKIEDRSTLLLLGGYQSAQGVLTFGLGATTLRTKSHLRNLEPIARLNGALSDATGAYPSFTFSKWMWGGAFHLGWIYPIAKKWMANLSYSYALTFQMQRTETSLFAHPLISTSRYSQEGVVSAETKDQIFAQSFSLTLDRSF